jgi:tripartite-type tricarboxylate transporter receptor subunit TctC
MGSPFLLVKAKLMKYTGRSLLLGIALAVLPALGSAADKWPEQPIRFVVPYPPGGPTDLMARLIADPLSKKLGTTVVVENKPGAAGNIGCAFVAESKPDGYTILLAASGPMAVNPTLFKKLSYDPQKDFASIIQISKFPLVLEVNPKSGIKSAQEFLAYAKANPDKVTFGSASDGTPQHLAGALVNKEMGLKMQHIPYKGAGPALNDLMGGHIFSMFDILGSSIQFIKGDKLTALAVTTAKRSPLLPNVPTLAESGVKGFDFYAWHGIVAPAGTPDNIIKKYNVAINEIFQEPDFKKRWEDIGSEVVGGTPEKFSDLIKSESTRLGAIVKEAGVQLD